jgi:hypothetical protein
VDSGDFSSVFISSSALFLFAVFTFAGSTNIHLLLTHAFSPEYTLREYALREYALREYALRAVSKMFVQDRLAFYDDRCQIRQRDCSPVRQSAGAAIRRCGNPPVRQSAATAIRTYDCRATVRKTDRSNSF